MDMKKAGFAAAMAFAAIAGCAQAQTAEHTLPVPSVGVVQDVAGASDRPDATRVYKLAVDMQSMPASPDAVSPGLEGIARLLNTYRAHGVPAENVHITAVFHGPTIALVTHDAVYQQRVGGDAGNPNLALLAQLEAAGVKFVVCGGSARQQNYSEADLLPVARMNMSATLTFIDLQLQGYARLNR
jgi:intracellular sulfur oxidation DsrE/DsrF family protein